MHELFRNLSLPHLFRKPGSCVPPGYEFVGTVRNQPETIFQALEDSRCRLVRGQKSTPGGRLPEGHVMVVRLLSQSETIIVPELSHLPQALLQVATVFKK